jgi:hypothetical protein
VLLRTLPERSCYQIIASVQTSREDGRLVTRVRPCARPDWPMPEMLAFVAERIEPYFRTVTVDDQLVITWWGV